MFTDGHGSHAFTELFLMCHAFHGIPENSEAGAAFFLQLSLLVFLQRL